MEKGYGGGGPQRKGATLRRPGCRILSSVQRRQFLASAALTAASASRVLGANDRVRVALIGCGGRGTSVARQIAAVPNVEYTVLCDCYDRQAAKANQTLSGGKGAEIRDFRRALERDDIDAVHVATPDHGHVIPAIRALEAGKHLYCEKPLGHNVVEGRAIVEASLKHPKQVFLTGTQHRSAPHLAELQHMVRDGVLKDVRFVKVWNYVNLGGGMPETPDEPTPEGLDWDLYLGPAPWVPFNRRRFLSSYRGFFDYAGGWITDFGIHRFDTVHQVMGQDRPTTVSPPGTILRRRHERPAGRLAGRLRVPGFILNYETINTNGFGAFARTTPGVQMHGARAISTAPTAWPLRLQRPRRGGPARLQVFPEGDIRPGSLGSARPLGPALAAARAGRSLPRCRAHFIRCVRESEKPRTDALTGHRSSLIAHLGNVSYKAGRKIWWDAEKEVCLDDRQANRHLGRVAANRGIW